MKNGLEARFLPEIQKTISLFSEFQLCRVVNALVHLLNDPVFLEIITLNKAGIYIPGIGKQGHVI